MDSRQISKRREQHDLAARLRSDGKMWGEIALVFRQRYRVNGRVALRLAHGLSQKDVADVWNARWPDTPKSPKYISYWEQWPGTSGHQPPLEALRRLAEIYECSVADLLQDYADYTHMDDAHKARGETNESSLPISGLVSRASNSETFVSQIATSNNAQSLVETLQSTDFNDLARTLVMWTERFNPNLDRRALLFKLSGAFAIAAAAPAFDQLVNSDQGRTVGVLDDPRRLDAQTVRQAERVVQQCRIQGDILGPQVALSSVMAERKVIQRILHGSPPSHLMQSMLSVYAELTQLAGWLLFNLGEYPAARHYYDEARSTAHDAFNVELVTYILCTMSHLATWEGKPRVGIDHAVAAQAWSAKSGSQRAIAYSADVAARAYAADKQWSECREALDLERSALSNVGPEESPNNWWYFHDESFYLGTESECALARKRPQEAIDASSQALSRIDPLNLHNYAATMSFQSEAYIQQGNIPEACSVLTDIARLTVTNSSRRLDQRIVVLRGQLDHWNSYPDVVQLDETLRVYRGSR